MCKASILKSVHNVCKISEMKTIILFFSSSNPLFCTLSLLKLQHFTLSTFDHTSNTELKHIWLNSKETSSHTPTYWVFSTGTVCMCMRRKHCFPWSPASSVKMQSPYIRLTIVPVLSAALQEIVTSVRYYKMREMTFAETQSKHANVQWDIFYKLYIEKSSICDSGCVSDLFGFGKRQRSKKFFFFLQIHLCCFFSSSSASQVKVKN